MSGAGFVIAAYIGAAILYCGYAVGLRLRERALEREMERRNRA